MLHRLSGITTDIVLTEGEYGFNEVLEDYKNATFINIVTYNIRSFDDSVLIRALREVESTVPINIVLNIPARQDQYVDRYGKFSESLARKAAMQIRYYLRTLEREKFGDLNVFFNFSNHAKLVMTNNIAYIGSQNYSDASSENFELGVIIRDFNAIRQIDSVIFNLIKERSIRYQTSKYIVLSETTAEVMYDVLGKLRESIFSIHDHEPFIENVEVFDIDYAVFPQEEWERLSYLHDEFEIELRDLSEQYEKFNSKEATIILNSLESNIKSLVSNLKDLANFKNRQEESMLWDTFQSIDTGDNSDEAMDIAMQSVRNYEIDNFFDLTEIGTELVAYFTNIEIAIQRICELIEEIKIDLIQETVYENIRSIQNVE